MSFSQLIFWLQERTKILKFSFNESEKSNIEIFEKNRFRQWNKNPMKIFFYNHYLRAKVNENYDPESLAFACGENLKIFSKKFNFTIKFVFSTDNETFGRRLENGTYTGSLGMIEYERADLAGKSRKVRKLFLSENFTFSGNTKLIIDYKTKNMLMLLVEISKLLNFYQRLQTKY